MVPRPRPDPSRRSRSVSHPRAHSDRPTSSATRLGRRRSVHNPPSIPSDRVTRSAVGLGRRRPIRHSPTFSSDRLTDPNIPQAEGQSAVVDTTSMRLTDQGQGQQESSSTTMLHTANSNQQFGTLPQLREAAEGPDPHPPTAGLTPQDRPNNDATLPVQSVHTSELSTPLRESWERMWENSSSLVDLFDSSDFDLTSGSSPSSDRLDGVEDSPHSYEHTDQPARHYQSSHMQVTPSEPGMIDPSISQNLAPAVLNFIRQHGAVTADPISQNNPDTGDILQDTAQQPLGARSNNFNHGNILQDITRQTLGPKHYDDPLQDITNRTTNPQRNRNASNIPPNITRPAYNQSQVNDRNEFVIRSDVQDGSTRRFRPYPTQLIRADPHLVPASGQYDSAAHPFLQYNFQAIATQPFNHGAAASNLAQLFPQEAGTSSNYPPPPPPLSLDYHYVQPLPQVDPAGPADIFYGRNAVAQDFSHHGPNQTQPITMNSMAPSFVSHQHDNTQPSLQSQAYIPASQVHHQKTIQGNRSSQGYDQELPSNINTTMIPPHDQSTLNTDPVPPPQNALTLLDTQFNYKRDGGAAQQSFQHETRQSMPEPATIGALLADPGATWPFEVGGQVGNQATTNHPGSAPQTAVGGLPGLPPWNVSGQKLNQQDPASLDQPPSSFTITREMDRKPTFEYLNRPVPGAASIDMAQRAILMGVQYAENNPSSSWQNSARPAAPAPPTTLPAAGQFALASQIDVAINSNLSGFPTGDPEPRSGHGLVRPPLAETTVQGLPSDVLYTPAVYDTFLPSGGSQLPTPGLVTPNDYTAPTSAESTYVERFSDDPARYMAQRLDLLTSPPTIGLDGRPSDSSQAYDYPLPLSDHRDLHGREAAAEVQDITMAKDDSSFVVPGHLNLRGGSPYSNLFCNWYMKRTRYISTQSREENDESAACINLHGSRRYVGSSDIITDISGTQADILAAHDFGGVQWREKSSNRDFHSFTSPASTSRFFKVLRCAADDLQTSDPPNAPTPVPFLLHPATKSPSSPEQSGIPHFLLPAPRPEWYERIIRKLSKLIHKVIKRKYKPQSHADSLNSEYVQAIVSSATPSPPLQSLMTVTHHSQAETQQSGAVPSGTSRSSPASEYPGKVDTAREFSTHVRSPYKGSLQRSELPPSPKTRCSPEPVLHPLQIIKEPNVTVATNPRDENKGYHLSCEAKDQATRSSTDTPHTVKEASICSPVLPMLDLGSPTPTSAERSTKKGDQIRSTPNTAEGPAHPVGAKSSKALWRNRWRSVMGQKHSHSHPNTPSLQPRRAMEGESVELSNDPSRTTRQVTCNKPSRSASRWSRRRRSESVPGRPIKHTCLRDPRQNTGNQEFTPMMLLESLCPCLGIDSGMKDSVEGPGHQGQAQVRRRRFDFDREEALADPIDTSASIYGPVRESEDRSQYLFVPSGTSTTPQTGQGIPEPTIPSVPSEKQTVYPPNVETSRLESGSLPPSKTPFYSLDHAQVESTSSGQILGGYQLESSVDASSHSHDHLSTPPDSASIGQDPSPAKSGVSGKTFGQDANTPGTGPMSPDNANLPAVPRLPMSGRSDEGMLISGLGTGGARVTDPEQKPLEAKIRDVDRPVYSLPSTHYINHGTPAQNIAPVVLRPEWSIGRAVLEENLRYGPDIEKKGWRSSFSDTESIFAFSPFQDRRSPEKSHILPSRFINCIPPRSPSPTGSAVSAGSDNTIPLFSWGPLIHPPINKRPSGHEARDNLSSRPSRPVHWSSITEEGSPVHMHRRSSDLSGSPLSQIITQMSSLGQAVDLSPFDQPFQSRAPQSKSLMTEGPGSLAGWLNDEILNQAGPNPNVFSSRLQKWVEDMGVPYALYPSAQGHPHILSYWTPEGTLHHDEQNPHMITSRFGNTALANDPLRSIVPESVRTDQVRPSGASLPEHDVLSRSAVNQQSIDDTGPNTPISALPHITKHIPPGGTEEGFTNRRQMLEEMVGSGVSLGAISKDFSEEPSWIAHVVIDSEHAIPSETYQGERIGIQEDRSMGILQQSRQDGLVAPQPSIHDESSIRTISPNGNQPVHQHLPEPFDTRKKILERLWDKIKKPFRN
ncbi:uncharacterized protein I206_101272 [Kwoniella pini CBS 10737]|uniref:Uncharacterized protein n=1 Tax=Kwoniella pini CBS 10737 TaxID=1296096 RepID=A0A1B9IBD6_9TREE|nr:uncharacterized protein I206_00050 [Kwoniella pini CBS 10737]OCF52754.1 hypothetical protein I206_00050 [Kwoniella pini CBS 10737]